MTDNEILGKILGKLEMLEGGQAKLETDIKNMLDPIKVELKEIQTNQAVLEREMRENRTSLAMMSMQVGRIDREQAVIDQSLNRHTETLNEIHADLSTVKEKVEFTATVLEGTLKMVDDLDQKYNAM